MMKFRNPWFVPPVSADEAKRAAMAPAVKAWLQTQTGNKLVSLAELRAGLPALAADLTRPMVNQILADLGIVIDNPDDQSA